MGRKRIDLTGQRFGRLVAIRRVGTRQTSVLWECLCDCGNTTRVASIELRKGLVISCGCYRMERISTHGESKTRLYRTWCSMLRRCRSPMANYYKDYGGRGIKVCDEWHDYETFRDWARTNGYRDDLTIERKDVNGNYEPSNCCWIPMAEQAKNRRNSVRVEYHGKQYILADLAREAGIGVGTLRERLKRGWSLEQAVETPVRQKKSRPRCARPRAAREKCAGFIVSRERKNVNEEI